MAKSNSGKSPSDSEVSMTELILPSHTNALGTAFGGAILSWIDIAAAIAAQRHARKIVVTASLDAVNFLAPIKAGQIVRIVASVNYASRTSMEVGVKVDAEDTLTGTVSHCVSAYLTFVGIDAQGKPSEIPKVIPETAEQKRRFEAAQVRRKSRVATLEAVRSRR